MKKIFSVILSISLLVSILALPVSAAFDTAVPVQSQTSSIKYISDIYLFEEIFHANDSISLISSPTYEITYTQEISQGDKADTSHVSMDVLFNINGAEYSTYLEGDVTSKVLANGVTLIEGPLEGKLYIEDTEYIAVASYQSRQETGDVGLGITIQPIDASGNPLFFFAGEQVLTDEVRALIPAYTSQVQESIPAESNSESRISSAFIDAGHDTAGVGYEDFTGYSHRIDAYSKPAGVSADGSNDDLYMNVLLFAVTTYVDNVYDQGMDIFPPQAILFNQIDAEITSENPNCAIEDFYLVPDTEKYEGAEDDFSRTLLAICADIADFFGSSIPGSFQDLLESIIPEDYIAEVESDNYSHFRFTVDSLYDTVDFDETPFLFSYRITPGNTTSYPVHVTSRVRFMVMSEVSTWYFYSESTDFTAFPQFAVI